MGFNKKFFTTGGIVASTPPSGGGAFDPLQNFETVTYTGNGSTQKITGYIRKGAAFNGSSSKVDLPVLGLGGNATRSVSIWVNPATTPSTLGALYHSGGTNAKTAFIIYYQSDNKIRVEYDNRSLTSPTIISNNTWTHIVATYNGGSIESSANTNIYINGVLQTLTNSGGSTGVANTSNSDYAIGYRRYANSFYFDGKIDQVRIYDTALNSTQVTELYTNETTATAQLLDFPVGAGCIAAYELDGNADDISGLYSGTPTNIGYTGMQFQPDFVWIKPRSYADNHNLFDSIRGATKQLVSNSTAAESTQPNTLQSFNSNGFTTGPDNNTNISGSTYVAWNWKAGGAEVSGSGTNVSLVTQSENAAAGFGIYRFKTTSSNNTNITINHNLNAPPEMVIIKETSGTGHWYVYHSTLGTNKYIIMSLSNGATTASSAWGAGMTSSVIGARTAQTVDSNQTHVAYAFHSVDGFSKIGSYVGTGVSGTPNITTGFRPAFIMVKRTDAASSNWFIWDNKRDTTNPNGTYLLPNASNAENNLDAYGMNFFSNGFSVNSSDPQLNANGGSYIFIAFAADPAPEPVLANSFDISLYTGNGTTQNVYSSLSPDLVWIKDRSGTNFHNINDSVRGTLKNLQSNTTSAEQNAPNGGVSSFDSNGFTLGTGGSIYSDVSASSTNYVAWQWKAAEIPAINSNGTITSLVNANPAAGFSIVKYTGNGTAGSTIGHGLSAKPELIFWKNLDAPSNWLAYADDVAPNYEWLYLNATNELQTSGSTNEYPTYKVRPTDALVTVNGAGSSNNINISSQDTIMYCFHSVAGYQKVGSYPGSTTAVSITTSVNGDAGFQPRFVLVKGTTENSNWTLWDSIRGGSVFLQPKDRKSVV